MTDLPLTKLPESTVSTLVLGWTPPAGALGYVLYADGVRKSSSWDPAKSSWKVANDGKKIRVVAFTELAEGAYPPVVTPPVDPPPASGWPAAPVSPITTVTNASGLGKNYTSKVAATDLIVDGSGDTAVLFQPGAAGSSLKRARLLRCAAGNSVSWGKHAIYGKAADLLIEDVYAECASPCASGFSLRYDGAVVRRCEIKGAPHAITYYETSTKAGAVLLEDVRGSFRGDTGVWMDAETDYTSKVIQAFTFRRVAMVGPGAFMKATRFSGSVRLEGCTLNGKPVTKTDLPGVPNVTVT